MQERGKLTILKAQAYLKAGKTRKSEVLDDFWEGAGFLFRQAWTLRSLSLASCLRRYPGRVISLHSDNGSESMPGHLTRFCHGRDITFTRSRPYQGNDNPHVEEKGLRHPHVRGIRPA
jgi:hypothetical protein